MNTICYEADKSENVDKFSRRDSEIKLLNDCHRVNQFSFVNRKRVTSSNLVSVSSMSIASGSNELMTQCKKSKFDVMNVLRSQQFEKNTEQILSFFTKKNEFSDLTLLFDDGKTIFVNKGILAAASDLYKSKLIDCVDKLDVKDAEYDEMLELLQFLYPQFHAKLTLDNINSLMRLSESYEICTLYEACRDFAKQYLLRIQQVKITRETQISSVNSCGLNNSLLECIQYSDGTRYPAYIECNRLCGWFKIYSSLKNRDFEIVDELIEYILNILQKLSTHVLNESDEFRSLSDSDKNLILNSRAKFLENELFKLDYFTCRIYDISSNFQNDY